MPSEPASPPSPARPLVGQEEGPALLTDKTGAARQRQKPPIKEPSAVSTADTSAHTTAKDGEILPSKPLLLQGQAVILQGLVDHPELNGRSGLLRRYTPNTDEWNVKLDNGEPMNINSTNLQAMYQVGDRVRCCDADDKTWKHGQVVSVVPLRALPDTWQEAFVWDYVEKVAMPALIEETPEDVDKQRSLSREEETLKQLSVSHDGEPLKPVDALPTFSEVYPLKAGSMAKHVSPEHWQGEAEDTDADGPEKQHIALADKSEMKVNVLESAVKVSVRRVRNICC